MDLGVFVFEYLYQLIEVVLIFVLASIYLNKRIKSVLKTLLVMVLASFILLSLNLFIRMSVLTIIFTLFVFFMFLCCIFDNTIYMKVVVSFLFIVITGIVTAVVRTIAIRGFGADPVVLRQSLMARSLLYVIIDSLTALIIYGMSKIKKEHNVQFLNEGVLLILLLTVFSMLLLMFDSIFVKSNATISGDIVDVVVLLLSFLFAVLVYFVAKFYRNKSKMLNYEFTLREAQLREQSYLDEMNRNQQILSIKHDLKNHLAVIRHYIESNDTENALCYLNSIQNDHALKRYINSENEIVNALINSKISRNDDIKFNVNLKIDSFTFESHVVTIVLGNALDNATEAVKKLGISKRVIYVNVSENEQYGKIVVSNPYLEVIQNHGEFLSTKGKNRKGIGIDTIKRVVKEHGGNVDIKLDDNIFRLTVLLKKEN